MTHPTGRNQRSEEIMTPELICMFEEAGPSWDPPTPEILERHGFLHTITWVQRCIDRRNRPKRPWEDAEIAVRKALGSLSQHLPELIHARRVLAWSGLSVPGVECLERLTMLQAFLPLAQDAVGPDLRQPGSKPWLDAASLIADEAIEAWRAAGQQQFGFNKESPVVRFTAAFLERAGFPQENDAISSAFQRARRRQQRAKSAATPRASRPEGG